MVSDALDADVVIVGAGMAGVTAAFVLSRAGVRVSLVDPVPIQPPVFKAEKIEHDQAALLRSFRLMDDLLPECRRISRIACGQDGRIWRFIETEEYGCFYHDMVNALRRRMPSGVDCRNSRVVGVRTSDKVQEVTLSDKTILKGRLLVLASGVDGKLAEQLGFRRKLWSTGHSVSFGFNLGTVELPGQAESLTYRESRLDAKIDYITLFPVKDVLRVNLFTYWDAKDPRVQALRNRGLEALEEFLPRFTKLTGPLTLTSKVEARPIHLHQIENPVQPGVVLLGDIYQSVCPTTGTGLSKVLVDVRTLSELVPLWLETPGMSVTKVARYYASDAKRASDESSLNDAFYRKRLCLDRSVSWRLRRAKKYVPRMVQGLRSSPYHLATNANKSCRNDGVANLGDTSRATTGAFDGGLEAAVPCNVEAGAKAQGIQITTLSGKDALASARELWTAIVASMESPRHVFHSFAWFQSYFESLETTPEAVSVHIVRRGGTPVLLVPTRHSSQRFLGFPVRVLELPHHKQMPFADIVCGGDAGQNAPLLSVLLDHLQGPAGLDWDCFLLPRVLSDSSALQCLERLSGFRVFREPAMDCFSLRCQSYEQMFRSLSKNVRRTFLKRQRKLESLSGVEFVSIRGQAQLHAALNIFAEIEAGGWKGSKGTAIKLVPRVELFYRTLINNFGPKGQCELNLLNAEGKCIAAQFCLIDGSTIYSMKVAYREDYASVSPGHMLRNRLIERCAARELGLETINFVTAPEHVSHWHPQVHKGWKIWIFNNSPRGIAAYKMKRFRTFLGQFLRRLTFRPTCARG